MVTQTTKFSIDADTLISLIARSLVSSGLELSVYGPLKFAETNNLTMNPDYAISSGNAGVMIDTQICIGCRTVKLGVFYDLAVPACSNCMKVGEVAHYNLCINSNNINFQFRKWTTENKFKLISNLRRYVDGYNLRTTIPVINYG